MRLHPNDEHRSPASTGVDRVAGSNSCRPNSSMLGRFNYSSDRRYIDAPGQLLVVLCEVFLLPFARRVWPLTFTARESRCASKLGPTAKIQKLLNDSFSDLVSIGMGHKSYFLHLLRPMSCKKKEQRQ